MKKSTAKQTSARYLYIFALLALITYVFTIGINGTPGSNEPVQASAAAPVPTADSPDPEPFEPDGKGEEVKTEGQIVTVSCFSSVECKTTWCRANAGKPRGQKVALNAKFGKAKAVYIPTFDKEYEVIGTTDYKTDVDVWMGDDHGAALQCGMKDLLVQIIR